MLFLLSTALASPDCATFDSCLDCTNHKTWTGSQCRWCKDDGHCHAELSMLDPCSNSHIAFKPSECPASPPAPPAPAPQASPLAQKVLGFLFHEFNITADPTTCITDVGRADVAFAATLDHISAARRRATSASSVTCRINYNSGDGDHEGGAGA